MTPLLISLQGHDVTHPHAELFLVNIYILTQYWKEIHPCMLTEETVRPCSGGVKRHRLNSVPT